MPPRTPLVVGERVQLTPRTLTAPRIAWKEPRGTVKKIDRPTITVDLDDGEQVQIHEDNVVRRLPPPPKPTKAKPRPPVEGAEEVPLW